MNQDQVVIPRESSHFGFYKPGSAYELVEAEELPVYSKLGLDVLENEGKLIFMDYDGDHGELPIDRFVEEVVLPYLQ